MASGYIKNQKYKKAVKYYEYLEPLSSEYTKKKVRAHTLYTLEHTTSNLLSLRTCVWELKKIKKYALKEAYKQLYEADPVLQTLDNIAHLFHNAESGSHDELKQKVEASKQLLESIHGKEKVPLHEFISLIYINYHKNRIEEIILDEITFEEKCNHFSKAFAEYQELTKAHKASSYFNYYAHKYLVEIYNRIDGLFLMDGDEEKNEIFEKDALEKLEKMYTVNQLIKKKKGNAYCLHYLFPFATKHDIEKHYSETIRSYKNFSFKMTPEFICYKFAYSDVPNKVKEKYIEEFPLFALMNDIAMMREGEDMFLKTYQDRYQEIKKALVSMDIQEKELLNEVVDIVYLNISLDTIIEGFDNAKDQQEYMKYRDRLYQLQNEYQKMKESNKRTPSFDASYHKIITKLDKLKGGKAEKMLNEVSPFSFMEIVNKAKEENKKIVKKYGRQYLLYQTR